MRSQKFGIANSPTAWWPVELGTPSTHGGSDGLYYAFFPVARKLAIRRGETINVYDTGEYQFRGLLQPVGSDGDFSFASQRGRIALSGL